MYRCISCYIIFLSLLSKHVDVQNSVSCYNCEGDVCLDYPRTGLAKCTGRCCYEIAVYTRSGMTYGKGCYNGKHCTDYCKDRNADYEMCDRCSESRCNNHSLPSKFFCYSCENCYEVNRDTAKVECRGPECCYVAIVRDTPNSPYNVYRGCIEWNPGLQCNAKRTRTRFEISFYNLHDKGTFVQFITGNELSKSAFNKDTYYNWCYNCMNCNAVTKDTPTISCGIHKFCYTVYVSEGPHKQNFANRGCSNYNNLDYACIQLEEDYKTKHKEGDFDECIFCDYPVLCNGATYMKYAVIQVTRPAVLCYKCHNCNTLTAETKAIRCLQDTCCYRAAIQTEPSSHYSARRGCLRPNIGESCDHTCTIVKNKFIAKHPNGTMDSCVACVNGDGDNCNDYKYTFPTSKEGNDPIMCYNCTNCPTVNTITTNIVCDDPSCCYSAKIKTDSGHSQIVRGCSEQNCSRPCINDYDIKYIDSCSPCGYNATDGCNSDSYAISTAETVKATSISCYSCYNCSQVTYRSGLVECKNVRCCYRALLEINPTAPLFVVRGCADLLPGQKCENACTYIERKHKQNHKQGRLHVCALCKETDMDACNNRAYDLNQIQRGYRPIKCYECQNCDMVTAETRLIKCRDVRCCYVAYLRDTKSGEFYTIRGCSRWKRGVSCASTCKQLHDEHLWEYPNGLLKKCLPCKMNETDYCNKYSVYSHKMLPSKGPRLPGMNCYDCTDCDNITTYTLVMRCPAAACCYTAHLKNRKDDFRVRVARGCIEPNENESCAGACEAVGTDHLWANPKGTFVQCTTCKDTEDDECNNKEFKFEKGPEGNEFIVCYNCKKDCDKITARTPTLKCPQTYSCYIALVTKKPNPIMYAIRGCEQSCKTLKAKHSNDTFHYCMTCQEDKTSGCNKNPYNAIKPLHQPTICYNCRRCNSINEQTETIKCSEPNCCYISIVRDIQEEPSFVIRGCVETSKDTCEYVRTDHRRSHPNGTWSFCMTCESQNGKKCNNNTFISPTTTTTTTTT